MLRTSLRIFDEALLLHGLEFLSSNAQDFIEEHKPSKTTNGTTNS